MPKNQQQQQQESHDGKWTRQRSHRRRAQHGQKVQPNQPAQHKKASANRPAKPPANSPVDTPASTTAKQGTRGNTTANNKHSQHEPHTVQRQAASNIADLPLKAASLNEAADRHHENIKPANWVPQSYSAAVGPASFWADVVTPLVGHKAPIALLLNTYHGTSKHEQLNKLTKGSRPFTQFRSIRGEQLSLRTLPADCKHAGCPSALPTSTPIKSVRCLIAAMQSSICSAFSAAMHMHQMMCSCACLNLTSLPCSSRWSHTHMTHHAWLVQVMGTAVFEPFWWQSYCKCTAVALQWARPWQLA